MHRNSISMHCYTNSNNVANVIWQSKLWTYVMPCFLTCESSEKPQRLAILQRMLRSVGHFESGEVTFIHSNEKSLIRKLLKRN